MAFLLHSVAETLNEGAKSFTLDLTCTDLKNTSDTLVTIQPKVCIKILKGCNLLASRMESTKESTFYLTGLFFEAHMILYLKHLARAWHVVKSSIDVSHWIK